MLEPKNYKVWKEFIEENYQIVDIEKREKNLRIQDTEDLIKFYFDEKFGINLEDSPQILEEYVYIEFWDDNRGRDRKFRIPYIKFTQDEFLTFEFEKQIKFILEGMVQKTFGL